MTRADYAAFLAEYIKKKVDQDPPLTPEQIETLRGLFDPIPLAHRHQQIHQQRQQQEPLHDGSSCACCCTDCGDLFAVAGNPE